MKELHRKNQRVISELFDQFSKIETLAAKFIKTTPAFKKTTSCYQLAYSINKIKAYTLKN